jgi:hypothetical protein
MTYSLSSNDYYGALNRRFDARIKKLHKISKRLSLFWDQKRYAFVRHGKTILSGTQIMNMPNRAFYDEVTNL